MRLPDLSRFLSRRRGDVPPLPCPDPPICIIGDVHGRRDLLDALLDRICARPGADRARIIIVGDLIDRGPDSAGVLARTRRLLREAPGRATCLMGNHERMLLDFLDDPQGEGARWITVGGADTLNSFGLPAWQSGPDLRHRATALRAALPPGTEDWLRALPLIWCAEGVAVTHAGADPRRPLDSQDIDTLLWGHPAFARQTRTDGLWVAHGHVIVPDVSARDGRIAVDTGAWRSGRLSAAWLDTTGLTVLSATAP